MAPGYSSSLSSQSDTLLPRSINCHGMLDLLSLSISCLLPAFARSLILPCKFYKLIPGDCLQSVAKWTSLKVARGLLAARESRHFTIGRVKGSGDVSPPISASHFDPSYVYQTFSSRSRKCCVAIVYRDKGIRSRMVRLF